MTDTRYTVVANHKNRTLKVWDRDCEIYVNRNDYIGPEAHDALIAQARTAHPELRTYHVAHVNHR